MKTKNLVWRVATDVRLQTNRLESRLQAIEAVPSEGRANPLQFIPYRFQFANKVVKNDKLLLAFDALVFSEAMGREPDFGKVVHGDRQTTLKVILSPLISTVRKEIDTLTALLAGTSAPELVLNRHCNKCEFQARCYRKAKETDDLSLLSGMSENERVRYRSRGLFSVTQLSYAYRPRRRSKRTQAKSAKYDLSLKALAIRENKIHVVGHPSLSLPDSYAFFDVEGTPDEETYYLIGLLLKKSRTPELVRYSLWADNDSEERKIWSEFLHILKREGISTLVHYGSYETTFLRRMEARYSALVDDPEFLANLISGAINVLSVMHGQIYFPCYSNGLKEIANFLGHRWSDNLTSGLNTIVCRSDWRSSFDVSLKHELCNYNYEDCQPLQLVTASIMRLCNPRSEAPQPGHAEMVQADTCFDVTPLGNDRGLDRALAWPHVEVSETEKEVKVTADLPGLEEKDVQLELSKGVLAITGEKKTESEDKDRLFSERFYGRFERRIPVEDVEEDKVSASLNGVLTVTLPKSAKAQQKVKRIAINGR